MTMEFRFVGKKAIVTGAGRGIGRAIAKGLADCGAEVHALSRTLEHLQSLQAEKPGTQIYQVDVTDWQKTRATLKEIGPVDLLVNNAGYGILASFLEATEDQFDSLMAVNVKAVFNVSQEVARGMVASCKGGSIVNISSQASQRVLTDHFVYCATKAAVDMMTKCMAFELGKHKIRVNAVNPTVVLTELGKQIWEGEKGDQFKTRIPLGKFAQEKDVVEPVLYLLSDKAEMINGTTLGIEGGFWTG